MRAGTEVGESWARHGDGVVDLALEVPDVDGAYAHALAQGAAGLAEPYDVSDEHGTVRLAAIATYGDTRHTLVDRSRYYGPFLPGFVARAPIVDRQRLIDAGLQPKRFFQAIDHVVGNVELGRMDDWVDFYKRVMGFTNMAGVHRRRHRHRVLRADEQGGRQRHPQGEVPAERAGDRQAQVADRRVPGVLRRRRARSTSPWPPTTSSPPSTRCARPAWSSWSHPDSYYSDPELRARIGNVRVPIEELQRRGILVDRDEDGYLLQIFTKPLQDRPTVFFELIERHGSLGFGKGNFKALFEAIEREQDRRGNL